MSGQPCTMTACRICTACVRENHGGCRKTVWCPDEHVHRICHCCGTKEPS